MSDTTLRQPQREAPSMFGPLVLIAIGLYFLLYNMGILPSFNWWAIARFWPLILVFAGANILVRQIRQPFGSLLSLIVGLVAIGTFGYLVFFTAPVAPNWQFFNFGSAEFKTDHITFPMNDVSKATVSITANVPGLNLHALSDSQQLIEGDVSYFDELVFDTNRAGSEVKIDLESREQQPVWFFNPNSWRDLGSLDRWDVGLNGRIPTALVLKLNANASDLDLRQLTLTQLQVQANASRVNLLLPNGSYMGDLKTNAGTMELTLPAAGQQDLLIGMSAGNMVVHVPADRAVQFTVDRAVGSFSVENGRLTLISQNDNNEVWESANFNTATDPLRVRLNISAGNVRVYSD